MTGKAAALKRLAQTLREYRINREFNEMLALACILAADGLYPQKPLGIPFLETLKSPLVRGPN